MTALTDDQRAYVIDHMIQSHRWGLPRIVEASTDQEAAKACAQLLGNSGFSHLAVSPGPCPGCDTWGERDEARSGWFCDTEDCDLTGQQYADITHESWTADAFFTGAIVVTATPRLGRLSRKSGQASKRDHEAPVITWLEAARYLRAKAAAGPKGLPVQTSLF
jgi:hypothetical protein